MRFSRLNNIIVGLIILVNGYVIILPFVPVVSYHLPTAAAQRQSLQKSIAAPVATVVNQPNSIVIPAMGLDQPVLEGRDTYAVLNQGVLHSADSSSPGKGGNTVLLGHRFTYSQPKGVFYYLNKIKTGDEIAMVWNQQRYLYRVSQIKVVPPDDTSIQNQTADSRLTLYTCTPLAWPKNRLVVIAELVNGDVR